MIRTTLICATILAGGAAQAANVNWVDWQSQSTDAATGLVTVTGQITVGDQTVDVTYTNPQGIAFAQTGTGTNYFDTRARTGNADVADSPFLSDGPNGVENGPTASEMIALRYAGQQTLTFSAPVEGLYFSYVSLNGNGYGFDRDFEILSSGNMDLDGSGTDACGYWGCGTSMKQVVGDEYRLTGTGEPHGTLFMDGAVTSISWNSLSNENWNGFTVGAADLAAPSLNSMTPVPLPASVLALGAGIGALGALRGRRKG